MRDFDIGLRRKSVSGMNRWSLGLLGNVKGPKRTIVHHVASKSAIILYKFKKEKKSWYAASFAYSIFILHLLCRDLRRSVDITYKIPLALATAQSDSLTNSKMVSRKSHPKSRNGCAQCKRRRIKVRRVEETVLANLLKANSVNLKPPYHGVLTEYVIKCDEVRPRCSNCTRHEIECDFAAAPKMPEDKSQGSSKTKRQRSDDTKSTSHSSAGPSPSVPYVKPREEVNGSGKNLPPLQMEELELLHHFTTQTSLTLSDRDESHYLWRVVVPQIAFEHEFLMRAILAISALHLSTLRPLVQDHYTHIAVQQQDAALRLFRAVMIKPDETNCDAFFAMSSLIVVYGFESPKASDSLGMFNYKGDHSDEWLPLIRGVNSIIQSVWECVSKGRLSRLLHDQSQSPASTSLPVVLTEQLELLEDLCSKMAGDPEDSAACKEAVAQLRWCFERMNNKATYECEVSLAFCWPVMIPQHFITILNNLNQEALVILAHYCIILHHLDDYWWMKGWAHHLIDNIQRQVTDDLQAWILFPSNVVNLRANLLTDGESQNHMQGSRVSTDLNVAVDKQLAIPKEAIPNTLDDKST